ncbi:MAG: restriction endonuclease subunit S [Candidatus Bathyarchaeia archaeon]|jgi:type I restriction enzyme S subunit
MSYVFYKEKEFVSTLKCKYPKSWKCDRFDSFITLEYGKGLPESTRREGQYPVFGSNGVVGYHDEKLVKGPGIVVGRKGTIGAVTLSTKDFWPIDTTFYVRMKADEIDWNWLFYELVHLNLPKLSSADVVPGLKRELVNNLIVPLPSLAEQQRVAEVLGVVDSAIEFADRVIAKTERLKKGLMQQLLTYGIGHSEYKETSIGKMPKEWGMEKLGRLVEIRSNKSVNNREKIAFIPMELVPDQQLFAKYQLRAREDVKSFTYCEAGDLLLAKITPSLENGKQGIVPLDVPNGIALATTEVFPLKCTGINKFFLFYVLKHSKFRNQIISSMIGTTGRQRASKESVEKLEIPLPSSGEQQRIAEIFFEVDKKLEVETAEKERLARIKQGIMDLLLTGKVRIKEAS